MRLDRDLFVRRLRPLVPCLRENVLRFSCMFLRTGRVSDYDSIVGWLLPPLPGF
jgi:hypothetical protein